MKRWASREPVKCDRDNLCHRREVMLEFYRQTTARGIYFHDYGGGPCHHGFSTAHTSADIH